MRALRGTEHDAKRRQNQEPLQVESLGGQQSLEPHPQLPRGEPKVSERTRGKAAQVEEAAKAWYTPLWQEFSLPKVADMPGPSAPKWPTFSPTTWGNLVADQALLEWFCKHGNWARVKDH